MRVQAFLSSPTDARRDYRMLGIPLSVFVPGFVLE